VNSTWSTPSGEQDLDHAKVHLWLATIENDPSSTARMLALLPGDEQSRAAGYKHQGARLRFITARGLLRTVLARFTGSSPDSLLFSYSAKGKPFLPVPRAGNAIHFNIAHSGELVLCGITIGRRIGVDIETTAKRPDLMKIAHRYFAPAEVTELESLPMEQRIPAFFCCWTRKEAYLKAIGEGISYGLDCFEVSAHPDKPARLIRDCQNPDETTRWRLEDIDTGPGYRAAIAVEGGEWKLKTWKWHPADWLS
jgi:4'-phosphopantetheinyl transferase